MHTPATYCMETHRLTIEGDQSQSWQTVASQGLAKVPFVASGNVLVDRFAVLACDLARPRGCTRFLSHSCVVFWGVCFAATIIGP